MERHVGLDHRAVAGPQAGGVLAPIGRVVEPRRVADARLLDDAALGDHAPPRRLDLLAGRPRPRRLERGVEALDHHLGGIAHRLGGPAQVDRARQRRVVAVAAAGELDDGALIALIARVAPGEVGGGGLGTRGQQRHDRRIVAAEFLGAADLGRGDAGHGVAFADPGGDGVERRLHRPLGDLSGLPHVADLGRRLDHPHPVDEQVGVAEGGLGQGPGELVVATRGEVVGVHLEAHRPARPARFAEHFGHVLHRVLDRRLDVVVGVAADVFVREEAGEPRPAGVLAAPDPDRLVRIERHDHHLVDIERPAVVAGEVVHVGRVADQQHLDAGLAHT